MAYRYLGYGITDNNGIAKLDHDANGDPIDHSYTGTGAGEIDIVASLDDNSKISDSSIQSEIYDIIDGWFANYYDGYVLGSGGITKEQTDNGVLFTSNGASQGVYIRKQGESQNYNYPTPCCLEFDVISFGDNSNPNIQFYDGSVNISQTFSSLGITGRCHVKCEYKSDNAYFTVDNGTPIVNNRVCTNNARLMLTAITSTLEIANVVIYPI